MTTIGAFLPADPRTSPLPHIGLVISPERQHEEGPLLRRLAVALVGEGALVTVIEPLPERDPDATQPERLRSDRRFELPHRLRYEARVPFWRRSDRLGRLAIALERAVPDIFWGAGADAWELTASLGEELDRPVALDLRRDTDIRLATKSLRSERVVAFVAPCDALAREARRLVEEQFVRVVPMGVRVEASPPLRIGPPNVVTILSEGRDDRALSAALRAARAALDRFPELMFTVEFPRGASGAVWRFARALGLLDRITALDGAAGAGLAMTAVRASDVVLLPEPRGGPRAEALVALSRGTPVIAAQDPLADALVDGETAVLLPAGDAHARLWSDALIATLEHPEHARSYALNGRRLVLERHCSASTATAMLSTVQDVLRGGPLQFGARFVAATANGRDER